MPASIFVVRLQSQAAVFEQRSIADTQKYSAALKVLTDRTLALADRHATSVAAPVSKGKDRV